MDATWSAYLSPRGAPADAAVTVPAAVFRRFLEQAQATHDAGLKSFGLVLADPTVQGYPYAASDVLFLDPRLNRRNEPGTKAAFEAQGDYFRRYGDAGFVADPADVLAAYRHAEGAGLEIVGMFHSHRRQPANFSWIDFRLHNPAFPWHLVISYAMPHPEVQTFAVDKDGLDIEISAEDHGQGSEQAYVGPEVVVLGLLVTGTQTDVLACTAALGLGALSRSERGAA